MMTKRLYYEDAYQQEFDAVVIACAGNGKGLYEIELDQSAFYPEGGGQGGDSGTLIPDDSDLKILVTDTQEKDGRIFHIADQPLEPGTVIKGRIDFQKRFGRMQNHSGEHIVSGLVNSRYGYNNVGFHMGSDAVTIDFDGELSMEQLREIEAKANEAVWENKEVQISVYDEKDCAGMTYRSKKELHGEVRIVTFPGYDVCACCGTHVKHTGEIGLIRIISVERFRGGVRVEMLCGKEAFEYDTMMVEQNHQVSVALSAKPSLTGEAVCRLKENASTDAFRVLEMEKEINALRAKMLKDEGNVLILEEGKTPDSLRRLADAVMSTCGGIACVFCIEGENARYAMGQADGDLKELTRQMNESLDGRGGGKPFFVQGSCHASRDKILTWAKESGLNWKIIC